jgi:hypothetical protein
LIQVFWFRNEINELSFFFVILKLASLCNDIQGQNLYGDHILKLLQFKLRLLLQMFLVERR